MAKIKMNLSESVSETFECFLTFHFRLRCLPQRLQRICTWQVQINSQVMMKEQY